MPAPHAAAGPPESEPTPGHYHLGCFGGGLLALLVLVSNAAVAVLVGFASGALALFPPAVEGCPKSGPCPRTQPVMDWTPVIAFGALALGALLIAGALLRFGPRSVAVVQSACAVILCLVAVNVAVTEWRDAHPRPEARIEPVLANLWEQRTWDVESVREALRELGYQEQQVMDHSLYGPESLMVMEMNRNTGLSRLSETSHDDTPPGSIIALKVRPDACVFAFVQPTNYEVKVAGPYLEHGCFEPPRGH